MENVFLQTNNLTKLYKHTAANKDITIELPKGEIIGFVGENGSGITTLLRMLTGLTRPTSGKFAYTQGNVRIGAIVENPAFFRNLTAKDNVIYQAKLCGCDEKNALQLLDTVGLADAGGKKVKNFSLGMKQRLGIAIAMLNNPDFLILDEPTNGLDPQGIVDLRVFLEKLVSERGITLLISSHILSELSQLATYYIFISHGKIIQTITAKALHASLGSTVRIKTTSKEASETFTKLTVDSMIKGYIQDGDEYVLRDPADYNSVIKALSTLDVKSLETENETLETYYLHLKGGRA
jgi:ABC-2 type transport system ATP-binding protein